MLQGQRVVLKGRMQVGLGRVASVAGLGEQGEIGEAKARRQGAHFADIGGALPAQPGGVEKNAAERQGQQAKGGENDSGRAGVHGGNGKFAAPKALRVAAKQDSTLDF